MVKKMLAVIVAMTIGCSNQEPVVRRAFHGTYDGMAFETYPMGRNFYIGGTDKILTFRHGNETLTWSSGYQGSKELVRNAIEIENASPGSPLLRYNATELSNLYDEIVGKCEGTIPLISQPEPDIVRGLHRLVVDLDRRQNNVATNSVDPENDVRAQYYILDDIGEMLQRGAMDSVRAYAQRLDAKFAAVEARFTCEEKP